MSYWIDRGFDIVLAVPRARRHSHIDVISLNDAAQVLVGGKDSVETVITDVSHNHLVNNKRNKRTLGHVVQITGLLCARVYKIKIHIRF